MKQADKWSNLGTWTSGRWICGRENGLEMELLGSALGIQPHIGSDVLLIARDIFR